MSAVQIPVTVESFLGLDNVNPPAAVAKNRFQTMSGVEIMNSGSVKRAQGCRVISSGSGKHSIFSDGESIFYREGSGLYRLESDRTSTLLDDGFMTTGGRTSYFHHFDRIYYSDNSHTGVIQNGVSRSWGLTPPPLPVVSNAIGDLVHGRYHVGITYLRSDGQESGTSGLAALNSTGGIQISVVPSSDSTVTGIGVYITSAGGDIPFLQAILPNDTWSGRIGSGIGHGRELDTNLCLPPFPCSMMAEYRGRMYMGVGDGIFFSLSGNRYELIGVLDKSFLPLGEPPTNIMPVDDGIWVTTVNHSMFLAGTDPHEGGGLVLKFKQKIGGIKHSGQLVDADSVTSRVPMQGKLALWDSGAGICFGGPNGYFKNITGDYFRTRPSSQGMSFARSHSDMDQYVFGVLASEMAARMVLPAVSLNLAP